jgi:PleD family two-component response regulator
MVISKLHARLTEQMVRKNWPLTLSIGVITCLNAPGSVEELLKMADQLMYSVKKTTKNAVQFATYTAETTEAG